MTTTIGQLAYSLSQLTIVKDEIKIKVSHATEKRINRLIAELQD